MTDHRTDDARDEAERHRLVHGVASQSSAGIGLDRLTVRSRDVPPSTVVERARQVLCVVTAQPRDAWPTLDEWRRVLPSWFVARCARERTREEADAWIAKWTAMSWDEKNRYETAHGADPWALSNWLHYFTPGSADEREWRWWDARVIDAQTAEVRVEVAGWPYASGALESLLRAAGATDIESDA